MGAIEISLEAVEPPLGAVDGRLEETELPLEGAERPLGEIERPLEDTGVRLGEIETSLGEMSARLEAVERPLGAVESPMGPIRRLISPNRRSERPNGRFSSPNRGSECARGLSSSPNRSPDLFGERSSSPNRLPKRPNGSCGSPNGGSVSSKLKFAVDPERHVSSLRVCRCGVRSYAADLTGPNSSGRDKKMAVFRPSFCLADESVLGYQDQGCCPGSSSAAEAGARWPCRRCCDGPTEPVRRTGPAGQNGPGSVELLRKIAKARVTQEHGALTDGALRVAATRSPCVPVRSG